MGIRIFFIGGRGINENSRLLLTGIRGKYSASADMAHTLFGKNVGRRGGGKINL
jgi:hypothetical protein